MIGNLADAALALSDYNGNVKDNILSELGGTRMVYIIDGIVYKVEGVEGRGCNEYEYTNIIEQASNLPENVFFPQTSIHYVDNAPVIAMEYIDGLAMAECYCYYTGEECGIDCLPPDFTDMMVRMGFDSGGYNVIVNDKGAFIIDAA